MWERTERDPLFRKSEEGDRRVWVDRGIDGRVDDFLVCRPWNEALSDNDPQGERWHPLQDLCPDCRGDFQAHALAVDLFALPRPLNGMLEDRVLTNDECAEGPRRAIPEAFGYFLPESRDRFLPGAGDEFQPRLSDRLLPEPGDRFLPRAGDYFLPGMEDYLLPGLGEGFLPGSGDRFVPDPGNGFLPGPADYFLPGMEDYFLPE